MNRSYLFVPADSDRKMAKAADAGADALIVDLEDAVLPEARPEARQVALDLPLAPLVQGHPQEGDQKEARP